MTLQYLKHLVLAAIEGLDKDWARIVEDEDYDGMDQDLHDLEIEKGAFEWVLSCIDLVDPVEKKNAF